MALQILQHMQNIAAGVTLRLDSYDSVTEALLMLSSYIGTQWHTEYVTFDNIQSSLKPTARTCERHNKTPLSISEIWNNSKKKLKANIEKQWMFNV